MDRILRRLLVRLLLFAVGLLSVSCATGQVILEDSTYSVQNAVYNSINIWIPHKELSVNDVIGSSNFHPIENRRFTIPNLGLHRHSLWFQFKVRNESLNGRDFVLSVENPNLSVADLYVDYGNGEVLSFKNGNDLPFGRRLIQSPNFIYRINLNYKQEATYYLKLKSEYPLFIPISINKPAALFNNSAFKNGFSFAFFGILFVMTIYNAFIAASTRDKAYWWYIIYLILLGLSQLSLQGFTYMYLWPNAPGFNRISVNLFSGLCGISIIFFSIHFLRIRRRKHRKVFAVFYLLIAALITAILLEFARYYFFSFIVLQTAYFVGGIVLLIVSLTMIKKTSNAKFFTLAWSILIVCSTVYILKDYGIFPLNRFTDHVVQLGSIAEIILLSLGLANRINHLRKQRDGARRAELNMVRANEKLIKEQNVVLNQKVKQRTLELETANDSLEQTLDQLKRTQSQLVATEKMSSLGQLTAGIAHEINNPINFVSANIVPLKRDIDQLFDTIKAIEGIGHDEAKDPAERLVEMAAYKEEQELDFLGEEIALLLKGIRDGAVRTAEIVKGLRTFSHLDEASFKESDVNEGLQSTLSISGNLLKGITLDVQYGKLPSLACYPGKLNQVFLNIITNAAFAIRKQHGASLGGKLTIRTWMEDASVFISFEDDGTGMDKNTLDKLYEPFFTTKPVGEGTGLGMSIVHSIMAQHHAQLSISSEVGKGSLFTIQLPINVPPSNGENNTEIIGQQDKHIEL